MTAEKEICLNWSRKNKELHEENWRGETDRKKTDENKSIEMVNHLMVSSIYEHYCQVFGRPVREFRK